LDLCAQRLDPVLYLLPEPTSFGDEVLSLPVCSAEALLPRFVLLPPLFANLGASVLAFGAADALPFIAAIAAEVIVTDAVVDIRKGYVVRYVTLVLAVEAREA
jgi:hypothetical protein